jgi:hypothetical protein
MNGILCLEVQCSVYLCVCHHSRQAQVYFQARIAELSCIDCYCYMYWQAILVHHFHPSHPFQPTALPPIYCAASTFFFKISFSVTASAANLLIPSRSFSTAMTSSLKKNRKSASSSTYVSFLMSRLDALVASSFLGTGAVEAINSSRRLGLFRSLVLW